MREPSEGTRLRIFIDENESLKGKPLYEVIVFEARKQNLAGATVLRGIMGYGAESKIHSHKILVLSDHMPVVVEIVDSEEKINEFIPFLDENVKEGLITMELVKVIQYRHD